MCVVSYLFAAVALSVIDTSSSNFLPENWTQFPIPSQAANAGSSPFPKVTVNSHVKEDTLENPTWGNNWTDVIGISNAVISQVPKGRWRSAFNPSSTLLVSILAEPSSADDFPYVCNVQLCILPLATFKVFGFCA